MLLSRLTRNIESSESPDSLRSTFSFLDPFFDDIRLGALLDDKVRLGALLDRIFSFRLSSQTRLA
jgi:hypothetical protein